MTTRSPDITYAYAQLGLDFGAPMVDIEAVLAHARAYQYSTRHRIKEVERFVEFFSARDKLGDIHTPFTFIRRAYHKKAMMLHPDRNSSNKAAEEQLKLINAAFAIADAMHREAKEYYRQSDAARTEIEIEARETTERETPPDVRSARKKRAEQAKRKHQTETHHKKHHEEPQEEPAQNWDMPLRPAMKYVAASIPRFIRTARLSHVPVNCVIASWHIPQENDINFIYDIVMLPEREFLRARMHMATPDSVNPAYQRGRFSPTYIPRDVKTVTVPDGEANPAQYARDYFLKEFGREGKA